jgi:hypothetical protein
MWSGVEESNLYKGLRRPVYYPLYEPQKSLSSCSGSGHDHRLYVAFDHNIGPAICQARCMIHYPVVRFVIGAYSFCTSSKSRSVLMVMCHYSTAAHTECRSSIVLATATVGSVGLDSSGLVDTAATILMLVAVLSSLACAGEPFKTKLIFSKSHNDIYLVGWVGF